MADLPLSLTVARHTHAELVGVADSTAEGLAHHVQSLRRKLGKPGLIENVRGIGYRFREGEGPVNPMGA